MEGKLVSEAVKMTSLFNGSLNESSSAFSTLQIPTTVKKSNTKKKKRKPAAVIHRAKKTMINVNEMSHRSYLSQSHIMATGYKRKIRDLLQNNKALAKALASTQLALAQLEKKLAVYEQKLSCTSVAKMKLKDVAEHMGKMACSLQDAMSYLDFDPCEKAQELPFEKYTTDLDTTLMRKVNFPVRINISPVDDVLNKGTAEKRNPQSDRLRVGDMSAIEEVSVLGHDFSLTPILFTEEEQEKDTQAPGGSPHLQSNAKETMVSMPDAGISPKKGSLSNEENAELTRTSKERRSRQSSSAFPKMKAMTPTEDKTSVSFSETPKPPVLSSTVSNFKSNIPRLTKSKLDSNTHSEQMPEKKLCIIGKDSEQQEMEVDTAGVNLTGNSPACINKSKGYVLELSAKQKTILGKSTKQKSRKKILDVFDSPNAIKDLHIVNNGSTEKKSPDNQGEKNNADYFISNEKLDNTPIASLGQEKNSGRSIRKSKRNTFLISELDKVKKSESNEIRSQIDSSHRNLKGEEMPTIPGPKAKRKTFIVPKIRDSVNTDMNNSPCSSKPKESVGQSDTVLCTKMNPKRETFCILKASDIITHEEPENTSKKGDISVEKNGNYSDKVQESSLLEEQIDENNVIQSSKRKTYHVPKESNVAVEKNVDDSSNLKKNLDHCEKEKDSIQIAALQNSRVDKDIIKNSELDNTKPKTDLSSKNQDYSDETEINGNCLTETQIHCSSFQTDDTVNLSPVEQKNSAKEKPKRKASVSKKNTAKSDKLPEIEVGEDNFDEASLKKDQVVENLLEKQKSSVNNRNPKSNGTFIVCNAESYKNKDVFAENNVGSGSNSILSKNKDKKSKRMSRVSFAPYGNTDEYSLRRSKRKTEIYKEPENIEEILNFEERIHDEQVIGEPSQSTIASKHEEIQNSSSSTEHLKQKEKSSEAGRENFSLSKADGKEAHTSSKSNADVLLQQPPMLPDTANGSEDINHNGKIRQLESKSIPELVPEEITKDQTNTPPLDGTIHNCIDMELTDALHIPVTVIACQNPIPPIIECTSEGMDIGTQSSRHSNATDCNNIPYVAEKIEDASTNMPEIPQENIVLNEFVDHSKATPISAEIENAELNHAPNNKKLLLEPTQKISEKKERRKSRHKLNYKYGSFLTSSDSDNMDDSDYVVKKRPSKKAKISELSEKPLTLSVASEKGIKRNSFLTLNKAKFTFTKRKPQGKASVEKDLKSKENIAVPSTSTKIRNLNVFNLTLSDSGDESFHPTKNKKKSKKGVKEPKKEKRGLPKEKSEAMIIDDCLETESKKDVNNHNVNPKQITKKARGKSITTKKMSSQESESEKELESESPPKNAEEKINADTKASNLIASKIAPENFGTLQPEGEDNKINQKLHVVDSSNDSTHGRQDPVSDIHKKTTIAKVTKGNGSNRTKQQGKDTNKEASDDIEEEKIIGVDAKAPNTITSKAPPKNTGALQTEGQKSKETRVCFSPSSSHEDHDLVCNDAEKLLNHKKTRAVKVTKASGNNKRKTKRGDANKEASNDIALEFLKQKEPLHTLSSVACAKASNIAPSIENLNECKVTTKPRTKRSTKIGETIITTDDVEDNNGKENENPKKTKKQSTVNKGKASLCIQPVIELEDAFSCIKEQIGPNLTRQSLTFKSEENGCCVKIDDILSGVSHYVNLSPHPSETGLDTKSEKDLKMEQVKTEMQQIGNCSFGRESTCSRDSENAGRRRRGQVSYKEPLLNRKMRRT